MNKLLLGCLLALSYSAMSCTEVATVAPSLTLEELYPGTVSDNMSIPVDETVIPPVEVVAKPKIETFSSTSENVNSKSNEEILNVPDGQLVLKSKDQIARVPLSDTISISQAAVLAVPPEVVIAHSIDPVVIRKLLEQNVPQFKSCYQKELDNTKEKNALKGIIKVKFYIGEKGSVNHSEIFSNEVSSVTVHECLKNVLQGIQFPAPRNGATVEVNQPLNLSSKKF